MNEGIKQAQIQTQVPSLDFYLTDIEKENLSLFKIQYLPIPVITRNALEKANITTLADLISTPDQVIKGIKNIGSKGSEEISKIKRKQIDELHQARGLQRPFPEDEKTLSLLSKLKKTSLISPIKQKNQSGTISAEKILPLLYLILFSVMKISLLLY